MDKDPKNFFSASLSRHRHFTKKKYLRGVSTRISFKRSPAPFKLNESEILIASSPMRRIKSFKANRKINISLKKNKVKKRVRFSNRKLVYNSLNCINEDDLSDDDCSVGTVDDGREPIQENPVSLVHINHQKPNKKSMKCVYWLEKSLLKLHYCLNEYRFVSNTSLLPKIANHKAIVAEYIWQMNNEKLNKLPILLLIYESNIKNNDLMKDFLQFVEKIDHENILHLYEYITDELNKNYYLIMEYFPHRCMEFDNLNNEFNVPTLVSSWKYAIASKRVYTEYSANIIMKQIISALNYLHFSKNVCLLNLNPECVSISHILDENYNSPSYQKLVQNYNSKAYLKREWYREKKLPAIGNDYWVKSSIFNSVYHCEKSRNVILNMLYHQNQVALFSEVKTSTCQKFKVKIADLSSSCAIKIMFLNKEIEANIDKRFSAPEIFLNNKFDPLKCESWSIGCFYHCLIYGKLPCYVDKELILDEIIPISRNANYLLHNLLCLDPKKRLDIRHISLVI